MYTFDSTSKHNRPLRIFSGIFVFGIFILLYIFVVDQRFDVTRYHNFTPRPKQSYNMTVQNKIRHKVCQDYYTGMGIGNLMFAFASSFGIAKFKEMDLVVKKNLLTDIFNISAKVSTNMAECKNAKTISPKKECSFDEKLLNISDEADVNVCRYLQSYLYFYNHSKELREQFAFKKDVTTKSKKIFENILNELNITDRTNVTLVGVHNRRGDMVKEKRLIDYGYNVATKEYLHKAVAWYKARFQNPYFIVISNDQNWTKANMPQSATVGYISQGNSPAVDMSVVTQCDHFISSVGSFSWWSGWLTGGNVTYLKNPAKNGTSLRSCYSTDYSDYFLSDWIGLE